MEGSLYQLISAVDGWQGLAIAIKTMLYGACFAASGGMFFRVLFLSALSDAEQAAFGRVVTGTALAGIVLTALHLMAMNGMLGGGWPDVLDVNMTKVVLATRQGPAIGLRIAGLLLVALAGSSRKRFLFVVATAGAVLAIFSLAVAGHASELAAETGMLPLLLIGLHLLAIAFWLGALWPLHVLTYKTEKTAKTEIGKVAGIMQQFGQTAIIVVGLLVAAGTLLLCLLLGSLDALWKSAYGQSMMGKLACVAVLLLLAAVNKLYLTPRLRMGDDSALRILRRVIRTEMIVAGVILLITAGITSIVGPPVLN